MKAIFITRELNGVMGGLERQILMITNGLATLGSDITVVSLEKELGRPFFQQDETPVKFVSIIEGDPSKPASFKTRWRRQKKLHQILHSSKPDVVVTFMIGSFILVKPLCFLLGIPVILSERNSPDIYSLTSAKRFKWLYFFIINSAKKITVQFPSYINKYPSFLRAKIVPIPNQVQKVESAKNRVDQSEIVFGYAGRLSFQKRIDTLIESFGNLYQIQPKTRLLIFGYGEQKEYLENKVTSLGLENCIEFRQEKSNVSEVFREIDIFCLFSIWEGFPNVLAEALAHGIPSVGFTTCDGVNDLIWDGINGWKLPFDDSSGSGFKLLNRAYEGFKKHEVSSQNCKDSVSKYSSEKIYETWQTLLSEVSR